MEALILYDTVHGNTRLVAQAIREALGERYEVQVRPIADGAAIPSSLDLLVVGGPTHRHGLSAAMASFLEGVPRHALHGVAAASFDTRYRGARWLTGSAGERIARVLKKSGAHLVAPVESFFIAPDVPPKGEKRRHGLEHLEQGEVERAGAWGRTLFQVIG